MLQGRALTSATRARNVRVALFVLAPFFAVGGGLTEACEKLGRVRER